MAQRNKRRRERPSHKSSSSGSLDMAVKVLALVVMSIAVIVAAYVYQKHREELATWKLREVLASLLRDEAKVTLNPETKVAVGFGSCKDIIVQSDEVLASPAPAQPEHFFAINTREELLKVFAYFYQHGAAAERYIVNSSLFDELVAAADKAPSSRHEIGGNAAVMAIRFAKEGCKVLLGAQVSKSAVPVFSSDVQISGPITEKDDIHLLLEYPAGQKWGPFTPPRANRFIIHNDHQNPLLSSLEIFSSQIQNFGPDLLVIGGLQMMDNFPMKAGERQGRLQKVQDLMKSLPKKTKIHFEMASYSDEHLMKDLVFKIIPYADSLGMNEQELPNLFHAMKYGNISLVSESYPRIAVILDQMRDVFKFLQSTEKYPGNRVLTRLHVHTLAFHALMIDKNSSWKNTLSAAAKSVLTANRHTCGSHEVDVNKAKLIMDEAFTTSLGDNAKRIPFDEKSPIACWSEDNIEICIAPVLVCTDVLQTGGGGDNISSAGLVLQI